MENAGDLEEPVTGNFPLPVDFTSQNYYGLSSYAELLSIENENTNTWTYQPGDLVLEELPYAAVVNLSCGSSICHACYQSEQQNSKLKRCARCRFARYCDDNCAKKAWPVHKMECALLAKYQTAVNFFPDALIRLVNIVMIKVWRGQMTMPADSCTPPTDREFDSLCSHTSEIDEELANSEKFKVNMQEIKTYMGAEVLLEIGEDIVAEVYSRVVTNTIGISNRTGDQLGIGLYLGISQFDHSCVPNAVYFAQKSPPLVQIIALAPIQSLKDVRIAYIDPMKPTQQRRAELRESYYFSCSCPRCHAIERDGMARSLACPVPRCGGFLLLGKDWLPLGPCSKCETPLENTASPLKDGKELMLTINDFIDANSGILQFLPGSPTPDAQFLELLLGLEQVSKLALFRLNYYRLRLATCLIGYYTVVSGDFDKALLLQMDLLEGYRVNLGPVSMPAFLALLDAVKWCRTLGHERLAKTIAGEAGRMAAILYGPECSELKELQSIVESVE